MLNFLAILIGKFIIFLSNNFNLGSGSTWPGHLALKINAKFIPNILENSKTRIIVICGTNGKTTTGKLTASILEGAGKKVLQNNAGANLLNGLASTLVSGTSLFGKLSYNYLVFETDENALPQILNNLTPDYLVCLNLFRDQLDRYGEIDTISKKWKESIKNLPETTTLILNSDDPQISYLGANVAAKVKYFGLTKNDLNKQDQGQTKTAHGADSTFCPNCSNKLKYEEIFFSHLGIWHCPNCKIKRSTPDISTLSSYPIPGTYNKYNVLAAVLLGKEENLKLIDIEKSISDFKPAFGRQEMIPYLGKKVQIFLSKNPTSFNESLQTIKDLGAKNLLIILNDQIPDGLDVSWIWDVNFEDILDKEMNIGVSGDRVYDMAVRLKYAGFFSHHHENPENLLNNMIANLDENETLYILPNYSAMLNIRKVLTGKKIL